jgi:hypothetical protein
MENIYRKSILPLSFILFSFLIYCICPTSIFTKFFIVIAFSIIIIDFSKKENKSMLIFLFYRLINLINKLIQIIDSDSYVMPTFEIFQLIT